MLMNATYAVELSLLRCDAVSQRGPFPSDECTCLLVTLLIKRGISAERERQTERERERERER